ncbi:MAG: DUF4347 domain-containing protein, partial [Thainema sp.]
MPKMFGFSSQLTMTRQIVVIDSQVDDYQQLVAGVCPGFEVFVLDAHQDGIEQITEILNASRLSPHASLSLHIVSHGSPGCIYLGNSQLSLDTLESYTAQIQSWFPSQASELLIYGCNVAAGDAGEEFLTKLHSLTRANIAASTHKVGNSTLGGKWILDVELGSIESNLAFQSDKLESYASVLAISVTQTNDVNTLLSTLLGNTSGLSNIQATTTGGAEAFGTFTNDPFGFNSGIVLSTGNVNNLLGPNDAPGTGSTVTGDQSGIRFDITFDVDAGLENTEVFFNFVFGSEEFPEYGGSNFNDSFQLSLNGTNLALLSDGQTVTINNLAPNGETGPFHPDYVDNTGGTETELDAYTKALTFTGSLNAGQSNTLSIVIADVGDSAYDSAVFLQGGSFGTTPTPPPNGDVTSPVLVNAEIDGTTLVLTYDEALDGISDPDGTAFIVNVNGSPVTVSSADANGSTVTLTLSSAVQPSDTVTVN